MGDCNGETEVFSRIVGYFRPIENWNAGKRQEFDDRQMFSEDTIKGVKKQLEPEQTYIHENGED